MRQGGEPVQADKKAVTRLLKTARGQLDGILNMIDEDRYCLDISQQVMACQSLLGKVNREILTAHLTHCIKDAQTPAEREEKSAEMVKILEKLM